VIEQVRQKHPLQYLRLIVSVLPKRHENERSKPPAERPSNEELEQVVGETKQLLAIHNETDES
jgi:hypothetical protein